jgi:hypothetical protein
MELEGSLQCLQKLSIGLRPKPDDKCTTPNISISFLAYFPYFEKIKVAYEITLLSVRLCVCLSPLSTLND